MDVRSRLAQLKGEKQAPQHLSSGPPEQTGLRPRRAELERVLPRAVPPRFPIERAVPGQVVAGEQGSVFVAETVHESVPGLQSGSPGAFLDAAGPTLAWLTGSTELSAVRADDTLFLDLETTGFGGAGIYPFLIGLAFFRDGRLHVQQLFMLGPAHEAALLRHFREVTQAFRHLVTFNGRTFDVHLLEDRFTLHRQACPLLAAPHFDVLFPSRQLWKSRFENCRLTTLERQVLGIRRRGDVDGGLIPAIYHQYVQSGSIRGLRKVFQHNAQDLVSLVSLSATLLRSCANDQAPQGSDEAAALGLLHVRKGHPDIGLRCLENALAGRPRESLRPVALRELSLACKRRGDHERAISLWQSMVQDYPGEPFAYEELAKWYEHTAGDVHQALHWTRRAAERLGRLPRFERRLQRLQRRPPSDLQLTLALQF